MLQVTIWLLSDNSQGKKVAESINELNLNLNRIDGYDLSKVNISNDDINIFIFDFEKKDPEKFLTKLVNENKVKGYLKFFFLSKKDIKKISKLSFNILHLEFISRPVNIREFLLLLEKSVIVARYRNMMKVISKEAESRIETYEELIGISRKNVFESKNEKEAFENILKYEKGLLKEQFRLNEAIKEYSLFHQSNLQNLEQRIDAEESLTVLRHKELIDAKRTIDAQESVIHYSANLLEESKGFLYANENVAELSRSEAIKLHDDLLRERELNKSLSDEIDKLLKDIDILKAKNNE